MELASIRGDTATLIYHPCEHEAAVGETFAILELPDCRNGIVVQVIENSLVDYDGLLASMLQHVLERRMARVHDLVPDRERGIDALRDVKISRAKIRKQIQASEWAQWDGWVPTRNVEIAPVNPTDLLDRVLPAEPRVPLRSWARRGDIPVLMDGARLGMVSAVVGQKGSGKSHLAKQFMLALCEHRVPVIAFDLNDEYTLPGNQIMRWTGNFRLNLAETGHNTIHLWLGHVVCWIHARQNPSD